MKTTRRDFLALAALPFGASASLAAGDGPVRLVIGFPPGDSADVLARLLAEHLGRQLKRPVFVDNRAGAAGIVAAQFVRNAPADGSTLMLAPSGLFVIYPYTYAHLPYDPLHDFKPVAIAAHMNLAIAVEARRGPSTMAELLSRLPREPALQNFGSAGAGSLNHFLGLRLGELTGVALTHVPYRGTAPAKQALLAGEVGFVVSPVASIWDQVSAGRVRVLATSGRERDPLLPEVPTLRECKVDIEGDVWQAIYAPGATPDDVVAPLTAAVLAALAVPELQKKMGELGLIVAPSGPSSVMAAMQANSRQWVPVIQKSGFKAE